MGLRKCNTSAAQHLRTSSPIPPIGNLRPQARPQGRPPLLKGGRQPRYRSATRACMSFKRTTDMAKKSAPTILPTPEEELERQIDELLRR